MREPGPEQGERGSLGAGSAAPVDRRRGQLSPETRQSYREASDEFLAIIEARETALMNAILVGDRAPFPEP